MQDLLTELFWRDPEISERAAQLCETLPGFSEARRAYDDLCDQIREITGPELYDQYFTQLIRYTDYEVCAYYSFGLGLREELVRALFTPQSSSPSPVLS